MSTLGEKLVAAAKETAEIARGEAMPTAVHVGGDTYSVDDDGNLTLKVTPVVAGIPAAKDAEIKRLRAALDEISATFNKPIHLQGHEPAMIAYAALKRPP